MCRESGNEYEKVEKMNGLRTTVSKRDVNSVTQSQAPFSITAMCCRINKKKKRKKRIKNFNTSVFLFLIEVECTFVLRAHYSFDMVGDEIPEPIFFGLKCTHTRIRNRIQRQHEWKVRAMRSTKCLGQMYVSSDV